MDNESKAGGHYGKEGKERSFDPKAGGNKNASSRNNRNNKRSRRGKGNQDRNDRGRSTSNDSSWYSGSSALLNAAASFAYTWPTGNAVDLGPYAPKMHLGSVPGIMAIYLDPQVGWADNENSPVTLASREEYALIRAAISGRRDYDPADLLLYTIALDSCFSFFSFLKRVYGICRTYSNVNRYYPKAIVEAMNVDFDDIMKNLANLNYAINVFATMFSRLNVPKGMSYITKHQWMYENVYTDANTPRGQTYIFVPRSLFRYALDAESAGKLERVILDPHYNSPLKSSYKYQDLVDLMNSLMDPIIADEDIGTISGDILKAYGDGGCIKVDGVDFSYGVAPVYNLEVLEIINNTTLMGPSSGDITQDKSIGGGWIQSTPTFEHYDPDLITDVTPGMNALSCDRFINFRRDNITPADSMVVTRLMNIADPDSYNPTTHMYTSHTICSETAAFARIFWFGRSADKETDPWVLRWTKPFTMSLCCSVPSISASGAAARYLALNDMTNADKYTLEAAVAISDRIAAFTKFIELISQFDYHPPIGLSTYAQVEADSFDWNNTTQSRVSTKAFYNSLNGFMTDLANYAIVGRQDLENLSEVALLNMLHLGGGSK